MAGVGDSLEGGAEQVARAEAVRLRALANVSAWRVWAGAERAARASTAGRLPERLLESDMLESIEPHVDALEAWMLKETRASWFLLHAFVLLHLTQLRRALTAVAIEAEHGHPSWMLS